MTRDERIALEVAALFAEYAVDYEWQIAHAIDVRLARARERARLRCAPAARRRAARKLKAKWDREIRAARAARAALRAPAPPNVCGVYERREERSDAS